MEVSMVVKRYLFLFSLLIINLPIALAERSEKIVTTLNDKTQILIQNSRTLTFVNHRIGFLSDLLTEKTDILLTLPNFRLENMPLIQKNPTDFEISTQKEVEPNVSYIDFNIIKITKNASSPKIVVSIAAYQSPDLDDNIAKSYLDNRGNFFSIFLRESLPQQYPYGKWIDIGTTSVQDSEKVAPEGIVYWIYKNIFVDIKNNGFSEEEVEEVARWFQQQFTEQETLLK